MPTKPGQVSQRLRIISQGQIRQHSPGAALFHPVRVESLEVRPGIFSAIINFADIFGPDLGHDRVGKVDFVIWRSNAGTQHSNQILGLRMKLVAQFSNRCSHDISLRSFFARVHEPDHSTNGIHQKDSAAIRDINPEDNVRIHCNQAIDLLGLWRRSGIDRGYAIAVNLFG